MSEGDNVQFLFTDADHVNLRCRVVAPEEIGTNGVNIDKGKYRELLLDAAETILSPLGFSWGVQTGFRCTKNHGSKRSGMRGRKKGIAERTRDGLESNSV